MDKFVVKYWLPFLLIILAIALFYEYGAVERIKLDTGYSGPVTSTPKPLQSAPRPSLSHDPTSRSPGPKSRLAAGQSFASLTDLVNDQLAAGFVRIGLFGKYWPATVQEIATGRNRISFVLKNGARHSYDKFAGYELKMVRLSSGDEETVVVFRSQEKR